MVISGQRYKKKLASAEGDEIPNHRLLAACYHLFFLHGPKDVLDILDSIEDEDETEDLLAEDDASDRCEDVLPDDGAGCGVFLRPPRGSSVRDIWYIASSFKSGLQPLTDPTATTVTAQ